jgi:pantoate--beta-alanine ligase
MSSRNAYLSPEERRVAPVIKGALDAISKRFDAGEREVHALMLPGAALLANAPGLTVQYLSIADPNTLEPRTGAVTRGDLVAIAAHLGKTRLIDNVLLGS